MLGMMVIGRHMFSDSPTPSQQSGARFTPLFRPLCAFSFRLEVGIRPGRRPILAQLDRLRGKVSAQFFKSPRFERPERFVEGHERAGRGLANMLAMTCG
jgi:hypothetical protein